MKRRNRGFSLTEVIVAMALIVMLSAVGMLSCMTAMRMRADGESKVQAYTDLEKLRHCYQDACDNAEGAQKEFLFLLTDGLEWYFGAAGLTASALQQSPDGAWTIASETGEIALSYYGREGEVNYTCEIKVYEGNYCALCILENTEVLSATFKVERGER